MSTFFFLLVKSYSILPVHLQGIMKKALFLPFLKVSIDHILITSSLEKESIVLEKSLETGRLRVVPHFSSETVERAKRERACVAFSRVG